MKQEQIPVYPLTDYVPPEIAEQGISVSRFEILNQVFDRPPGVHRHDHFELFWLRGPATHFNDFERYEIERDRPMFVFVSPGQLHRWEGTDAIVGTLISFTSAFIDGSEPSPGVLVDCGYVYRREFPPVLAADAEFVEEVEPVLKRCEKEFDQRREGWLSVLRATLRLLLASACRAHRRSGMPHRPMSRSRTLFRKFQMLVEEQFRTQSSVAGYAETLSVTPGHLSDVVRELTGGTAGEVIRNRILLEARRLLFHSELTVSEIAYHLGFEDPSYFAKAFRKATGESPASFRKKYRDQHK